MNVFCFHLLNICGLQSSILSHFTVNYTDAEFSNKQILYIFLRKRNWHYRRRCRYQRPRQHRLRWSYRFSPTIWDRLQTNTKIKNNLLHVLFVWKTALTTGGAKRLKLRERNKVVIIRATNESRYFFTLQTWKFFSNTCCFFNNFQSNLYLISSVWEIKLVNLKGKCVKAETKALPSLISFLKNTIKHSSNTNSW